MFWDLRECIAPASAKYGYNIKFDMSLPGPLFYDIVEQITNQIQSSDDFTSEEKKAI